MTFDFRSVPRVGKLAVTFFPGLVEPSLRHFLEEQGITGWIIVSKRDALARFPDTKVPEDIYNPAGQIRTADLILTN